MLRPPTSYEQTAQHDVALSVPTFPLLPAGDPPVPAVFEWLWLARQHVISEQPVAKIIAYMGTDSLVNPKSLF